MSVEEAKKRIDPKERLFGNIVASESISVAIGSSIIEKGHIKTVKKRALRAGIQVK